MKRILVPLCLAILIVFSCKKDNKSDDDTTPSPTTERQKKFIVDTTISKFISTQQDIVDGNFKYNKLPGIDSLKKGDFLIEPRDQGYLRKIVSITSSNGEVIVNTTQGTLSEFYKDSGNVKRSFTLNSSDNPFARTSDLSIPDFKVSGSGWSVDFSNMSYSFTPNFAWEFNTEKEHIKLGFVNSNTSFKYNIKASLDGLVVKEEESFHLKTIAPNISKFIALRIPGLFASIEVVDFIAKVSVDAKAKATAKLSYQKDAVTNAYVEYNKGTLGGDFSYANTKEINKREYDLIGGGSISVEIYPVFMIREFGVPIIESGIKGVYTHSIDFSGTTGNWNSSASVKGAVFCTFENTMFAFLSGNKTYSAEIASKEIWAAPKKLQLTSGDQQTGGANQKLSEPIRLKVLDSEDSGQELIKVYFSSNFGKWESDSKISTPLTGEISNAFTMGNTEEEHVLTAIIKDASNKGIDSVVIKIKPVNTNSLSVVAGNNQIGSQNANLSNSLVVAVKNASGQGVPGVEVQWLVAAGGGQLTSLKTNTGQNGQATNTWKLGASGTQTVQAKVLKADGSNVPGSPAVFTASIGNNDTIALLTSKPWTAYEGFYDGNETVIGMTYKHDALCGNTQYQYSSRTDSLRFTFEKSGKGSVQGFGLWSSIDNNCNITETTTDRDAFIWEYIPSLKRIKITWMDDATGEVDDEGWIMNIISLTATGMYTKGTEWWVENGNTFYDDNLELKFR